MQTQPYPFRPSRLAQALVVALFAAPLAQAQTTDLGSVQAGANAGSAHAAARKQHSAPAQAITQALLSARQPQSVISRHVIENTQAASANYSDIINIAPSVVSVDPNGPGMMESQGGPTIRGFQDGQYNVTFDGIPWGDSNDFTHHTTSYFMQQDIGDTVVDRGPGDASNIGPATFGGTVALHSKDPLDKPRTTLYGTVGSFGTRLLGAEFDTGVMKNYGDLRAFIDYRQLRSDGYLSHAGLKRQNLFIKAERPVGDSSLLTFVAMKNDLTQHVPYGVTSYPYVAPQPGTGGTVAQSMGTLPGQLQVFGPSYGLSGNPNSQGYSAYNYDNITTDFEYVDLKTSAGDLQIDNKVYTYAYYHNGYNGVDPNGGGCNYGTVNCLTPDGTFPAGQDTPNNADGTIPGQAMYMNYRSWGDLLRTEQRVGPGSIKAGLWYDHQSNGRYQGETNISTGAVTAIDRLMTDTLTQAQPYVEYAWNATPSLVVTPGLKYAYFRRSIDATVNQKTGTALNYAQTWTKALPAIDLHYAIAPNWTAYAQAAKGFLAPNLKDFFVADPAVSSAGVAPEQTTNYQVGSTWKSRRMTLSGDIYAIDFSNQVQSQKIGGVTYFRNLGKTSYRGIEAEGTYYVGTGVSVYANAAYNKATVAGSGLQVDGVPKTTEALGLVYNDGPWYASAITKFVGSRYGASTDVVPGSVALYPLAAYHVTNLALNYTAQGDGALPKGAKLGVQLNNVFDATDVYAYAGQTGNGIPLFWTIPGRSVMLNFSYPFN